MLKAAAVSVQTVAASFVVDAFAIQGVFGKRDTCSTFKSWVDENSCVKVVGNNGSHPPGGRVDNDGTGNIDDSRINRLPEDIVGRNPPDGQVSADEINSQAGSRKTMSQ